MKKIYYILSIIVVLCLVACNRTSIPDTFTTSNNIAPIYPTYQDVCTDETGFAETVRVCYDPTVIGLDTLLTMYFLAIDPLSVNKQGEDEGTQYRTGIYYCDSTDLPLIEQKMDEVAERYNGPLAVEVQPLRNFYPAEDYHQDYLEKNPTGYCHVPVALFEMARRFRCGE